MSREWARLELAGGSAVWPGARARFLSQVTGPRFEAICRDYAIAPIPGSSADRPGGRVRRRRRYPANRTQIQIDVAVLARPSTGRPRRSSPSARRSGTASSTSATSSACAARGPARGQGIRHQERGTRLLLRRRIQPRTASRQPPTSGWSTPISSTRISALLLSTRPSNCSAPIRLTPRAPGPGYHDAPNGIARTSPQIRFSTQISYPKRRHEQSWRVVFPGHLHREARAQQDHRLAVAGDDHPATGRNGRSSLGVGGVIEDQRAPLPVGLQPVPHRPAATTSRLFWPGPARRRPRLGREHSGLIQALTQATSRQPAASLARAYAEARCVLPTPASRTARPGQFPQRPFHQLPQRRRAVKRPRDQPALADPAAERVLPRPELPVDQRRHRQAHISGLSIQQEHQSVQVHLGRSPNRSSV